MTKKTSAANVTSAQLNSRLKKGELLPVYLLYGPEQGLLQAMAQRLMEAAVPKESQPMLLTRLEGDKLAVDRLIALCRTVPFLGERRCVVVSDFALDKLGKADGEGMKQLLKAPSPFTVLLLAYSDPELDLTKAKWKPYLEEIKKVGVVCEFAHKTPSELNKALCAYCAKRGGNLPSSTAAFLVDRCGVEYSMLTAEADKLLAYAHGREITREDVEQLCSKTIERSAFDLAAALVEGRAKDAFTMLEELFALQQKPVMILGAVSASFLDLYRLRLALDSGRSVSQLAQDFGYRSSWRLERMVRQAGRDPLKRIQNCVLALAEADKLLKSSKMEDSVILETAMGKMLSNS